MVQFRKLKLSHPRGSLHALSILARRDSYQIAESNGSKDGACFAGIYPSPAHNEFIWPHSPAIRDPGPAKRVNLAEGG